jgi:hypothetical protein
MKVFATITANNGGIYTARTNFGQTITATSLRNVPLAIGQQVAVFEVDGSFGAIDTYGTYKSSLTIPEAQRAGIYPQNPANTALAYIGRLANNERVFYSTATVTAIEGARLRVSGSVNGLVDCVGVIASDFTVGDIVLLQRYPSTNCIGWWNTATEATAIADAVFWYYEPGNTGFSWGVYQYSEKVSAGGSGIDSWERIGSVGIFFDLGGETLVGDPILSLGGLSTDRATMYLVWTVNTPTITITRYFRYERITDVFSGTISQMNPANYAAITKIPITTSVGERFNDYGDYCRVEKNGIYVKCFYNKPIKDAEPVNVEPFLPAKGITYQEFFT